MDTPQAQIKARLLGTVEGGRETPIAEGYRSMVRIEDSAEFFDAKLVHLDPAEVSPGEVFSADLVFLSPERATAAVGLGARVELLEGPQRVVASGEILPRSEG